MKCHQEDRMQAVQRVLRDHLSAVSAAARLGCHTKDVQHRIARYERYGEAGLLLKRDFSASAPNRKWPTDVTGVSLFGGKRYLSPIMDLFN